MQTGYGDKCGCSDTPLAPCENACPVDGHQAQKVSNQSLSQMKAGMAGTEGRFKTFCQLKKRSSSDATSVVMAGADDDPYQRLAILLLQNELSCWCCSCWWYSHSSLNDAPFSHQQSTPSSPRYKLRVVNKQQALHLNCCL